MKLRILTVLLILFGVTSGFSQTVNPILWQKKAGPVGGEVKDIEYDPVSGKTFAIVGPEELLYVSTNDGTSWTAVANEDNNFRFFNDIEITNGTIYLTTSFDVWTSTNGGTLWTEISGNHSFNSANRIKRLSSGRLIVVGNGGIHVSDNNGNSWSTPASLTGLNPRYLEKTSADLVFIVKDDRVYKSVNNGASFAEFSSGIAGIQVHSIAANNDGSNIYCVTATNIYISDGNSTWASIKAGSVTEATISNSSITDVSFLEFTADGAGMYFMDNNNHRLHAKTVSGAATTWAQRQTAFPSPTSTITNATSKNFPAASSVVLFGSKSNIIKTTNGATSFLEANSNIPGIQADNLLADDAGNLFMVTENRSAILRSTDEGNTWTKLAPIASQLRSFNQNPARDMLYASTVNNGAMRSANDGTSWTAITLPGSVSCDYLLPADNDKVFAISGNSLFYSFNDGVNWVASPAITGFPGGGCINTNLIVSASANHMLFWMDCIGSVQLWKITFTYSGTTLTAAAASQITTLPFLPNNIRSGYAAMGNYYLYNDFSDPHRMVVSTDGGATWTNRNLTNNIRDVYVAHNGYVIATNNFPSQVLISRDNGATFQETTLNSDVSEVSRIEGAAIHNTGKAFLAFDGDFIHSSSKNIVLPNGTPSNLAEVGRSSSAVAIRWDDNSTNEEGFEIFQSTNGIDFIKSGEADDNCNTPNARDFFVASGLQPNTNYTFRIRAENEAGSTAFSQIAISTTSSCAQTIPDNRSWSAVNTSEGNLAIVAPKNVSIRHVGGGRYSISDISLGALAGSPYFSSDDPASFYESCGQTFVARSNDSDIKSNGAGTWNGTNLITLKWRACASNEIETINLTLNATDPAPDPPANVNAYNLSASSIEVNWSSGLYDKTYIIERSTNSSSGFVQVGTTTYPVTRFIDNTGGLILGTTYFYRVKARNANTPSPDVSAPSANASITFATPKFLVSNTNVSNYVSATVGSYWADFNNDGFEDYLTLSFDPVTERGVPVIFRNNGAENFVVTNPAGIEGEAYFIAAVGDYDNDGFQDVAMTGNEDLILDIYRGNGDFTFIKVTSGLADLHTVTSENIEISSISWGDINNDGLLDLVVVGEASGGGSGILLYEQNSNNTFAKIAGGDLATDTDFANGVAWADYNNDGFQDLLLISADGPLRLYENNHDKAPNHDLTFTKKTGIGLVAEDAICATWADYNNDGFLDLYVGKATQNLLFKNNGDETFTSDNTTSISEANTALSASWGDFNNDGFLDLYTGGFVGAQSRLFLRNASSPSTVAFNKFINEKVADLSVVHYGVSVVDYNQDGFTDISLSNFTFSEDGDEITATNTNLFKNNINTGNWSEVKLAPTSGNKAGVGARVSLTAGGITQTREIQSSTTFVSKGSNLAHFGIGASATITNIQVKWANGNIQNYPNPPKNQILTIDQDNVPPSATAISPLNNATGVAANSTISITFDQPSTPVAGKFLLVYLHSNMSSPVTGVDVATAVKTGETYTFTISPQLLPETQYNISVDAGAFIDKYANPSLEMPTGNWTFTTAPSVDATAPTLTLGPEQAPAAGFGTRPKQVTATDNVGVTSVVFSIRKISGSAFTEVPAVQGTDPTKWNIVLSEASHFDATGTELFVTATDAAGNTTRNPATGTHKIYLTYEGDQAATIDSDHIGFGGTKSSWKIFSIPFELGSNNAVTTIFDEVTGNAELKTKVDYSLLTIQSGGTEWTVYPNFSTINRGQGYFINIKTATTIKIPSATAPTNSRDNLFKLNLAQGWNMVGNPYLTSISWANVATLNGLTGDAAEILKYNGTSYASGVQTLEAWEGAFVFSAAAVSDVSIPFLGQTSSGGRKGYKGLGSDINADEWMVKLNLNQGERSYELGAIGMAPDASTSYDEYDAVTPPRFFDYLEMNFAHPEFFAKRFTRDVVPTQNAYTWEFSVDATLDNETTLNWDNSAFSTAAKDIFLLDVSRQVLVSMKEMNSYSFNPKESANFRVFFGEDLRIAPERVQLGKAYPNPTSGLTTVAFSLPESEGTNQLVTMDIVDATGRPMGILKQGYFNPGYHELAFDAKELNIGFYLYRLSVRGQKGKTSQVNKLVIK